MPAEENKDLVRRFLQGPVVQSLQGDPESVRAYLTPDFVFHSPVVSSAGHHHDRLVQEASAFGGMLPNHGVTVDHILAEDDMVAAHFTFRQAEDAEIGAQGIAHYRLRDGKISELWYYSSVGAKLVPIVN
ncbi:MAG: nuclear transport factor 2 family protein [Actinomycetota bacterium]|nr:nuclear transport factor 2 family protein [Actinomycetota bacterium]